MAVEDLTPKQQEQVRAYSRATSDLGIELRSREENSRKDLNDPDAYHSAISTELQTRINQLNYDSAGLFRDSSEVFRKIISSLPESLRPTDNDQDILEAKGAWTPEWQQVATTLINIANNPPAYDGETRGAGAEAKRHFNDTIRDIQSITPYLTASLRYDQSDANAPTVEHRLNRALRYQGHLTPRGQETIHVEHPEIVNNFAGYGIHEYNRFAERLMESNAFSEIMAKFDGDLANATTEDKLNHIFSEPYANTTRQILNASTNPKIQGTEDLFTLIYQELPDDKLAQAQAAYNVFEKNRPSAITQNDGQSLRELQAISLTEPEPVTPTGAPLSPPTEPIVGGAATTSTPDTDSGTGAGTDVNAEDEGDNTGNEQEQEQEQNQDQGQEQEQDQTPVPPVPPSHIEEDAVNAGIRDRIKFFQRASNLEPTGEMNDDTRTAIAAVLASNINNPIIELGNGERFVLKQDGVYGITADEAGNETLGDRVSLFSHIDGENTAHAATVAFAQELVNGNCQTIAGEIFKAKIEYFAIEQREKLLEAGLNSADSEAIIRLFDDNDASTEELRTKYDAIVAGKDLSTEQESDLFIQILALEQRQEAYFANDRNINELLTNPEHYRDFHQQTAALDILNYFSNGTIHNSLDQFKTEPAELNASNFDNSVFAPEVYDALNAYGEVDGGFVDPNYAGTMMTKEDLGDIALKRVLEQADAAGIAHQDITKAMFEGRFNPDFRDLEIIHEGFKPATTENMTPAQIVEHQNAQWNKTFGDINDMGPVNTSVNGKDVTLDARDLGMRLTLRFTNTHDFERNFGIEWDGDLTYDQAVEKICETHPENADQYIKNLDARIDGNPALGVSPMLERQCGFSYFRLSAWKPDTGTNFNNDYQNLHTQYMTQRAELKNQFNMAADRMPNQVTTMEKEFEDRFDVAPEAAAAPVAP
jgi:hypothetical protein